MFLVLYAAVLLVLLPTRWTMPNTAGRVHAWLWALGGTLMAIPLALVYWPTDVRWVAGVLELRACRRIIPHLDSSAQGQTWGFVTFYRGEPTYRLRRHEGWHAWQHWGVWGPLLYLVYPVAWLSSVVQGGGWRGNWFEQDARAHEVEP